MGDRFYQQQLQSTGGLYNSETKRRKSMWDDERRNQAVEAYTEANPTPENSMEIVREIADSMGETPNGVRMVLTKAEVYIKKAATATKASGSDKPARVSKDDSLAALRAVIEESGGELDDGIISRKTGKAAIYFTELLKTRS